MPQKPQTLRRCGAGRIGRSQDERLGLVLFARSQLADAFDRPAERELRTAETFDEVPAPDRKSTV